MICMIDTVRARKSTFFTTLPVRTVRRQKECESLSSSTAVPLSTLRQKRTPAHPSVHPTIGPPQPCVRLSVRPLPRCKCIRSRPRPPSTSTSTSSTPPTPTPRLRPRPPRSFPCPPCRCTNTTTTNSPLVRPPYLSPSRFHPRSSCTPSQAPRCASLVACLSPLPCTIPTPMSSSLRSMPICLAPPTPATTMHTSAFTHSRRAAWRAASLSPSSSASVASHRPPTPTVVAR